MKGVYATAQASNPSAITYTIVPIASAQKEDLPLRRLLHEPIFMMQPAEYGSLYNPVPDGQTESVLVRRNLVRHGLRQTGAQRELGPSAVIVDCPIPNRHLQMAFVEGNQEVQTFATKAAAQTVPIGNISK